MQRSILFDAVRTMLGRGFRQAEVSALDAAIDAALLAADAPPPPPPVPLRPPSAAPHSLGDAGKALIRKWEGCAKLRSDGMIEAYPDPGSADGHPWTIGWGSTGADIRRGTVWTQGQCDARFDLDVDRFVNDVARAVQGAPTTASQFDAMVRFHYNTGKIASATLTKMHRAGNFAGAQAEFGRWVYNNGKVMKGLASRRAEEAALYGGGPGAGDQ